MNFRIVLSCLIFFLSAAIANAEMLSRATGQILLTVSGNISAKNTVDSAVFDMKMLQNMPRTKIETTTIWTDGKQTFSGVSLHEFVDRLDMKGSSVIASAINDYHVEIPLSDAIAGGPIIAFSRNGAPMLRRDKGPLWIIYPFDSKLEYKSETIYSRSIWQLDRIEVVD
ncbi:molybdopterin-dependent oxidoreductase [Cognatishimia sp. WU-CL00825]|uniref:oxidoreductase n=1 Tax=Cognatishimia sp. WU-CL00825 TaxID=3127658 RepID=UPI00310C67F2